ncbi:MAG: DUF2804 domain-containing protein [Clostridia bacterium]|nr:DUF2804 domain-containing protein [Clostridia bacterium]
MQHLLKPGRLLNERGQLNEAGYALSLVKEYDRTHIAAAPHRIKEWDYYLVYNDRFALALTIDDNSYMGLLSASFIDFANRREVTCSPLRAFTFGRTQMPSSSREGDIRVALKNVQISFEHTDGKRALNCSMPKFPGGGLEAHIALTDEPRDSMVIATPFAEDAKAFYYNQKIIGMRASGTVRFEGREYTFSPDDSFGLLDWGRGVWTYDNTWYWGAAQGVVGGRVFGFNIGCGFGDTSAASENMLFYDGAAHKLDRLKYEIPMRPDGTRDYLAPYAIKTDDGRLDLLFTPIIDRSSYTSIGIVLSDQHQVFGRFSGSATLDCGTTFEIKDLTGFAELVRNKW